MAKCLSVHYFSMHVYENDHADLRDMLDRASDMMASGSIIPRAGTLFPLAQAAQAHRFLESGEHRGRIFLRPRSSQHDLHKSRPVTSQRAANRIAQPPGRPCRWHAGLGKRGFTVQARLKQANSARVVSMGYHYEAQVNYSWPALGLSGQALIGADSP